MGQNIMLQEQWMLGDKISEWYIDGMPVTMASPPWAWVEESHPKNLQEP
jgi:hypothetical protein